MRKRFAAAKQEKQALRLGAPRRTSLRMTTLSGALTIDLARGAKFLSIIEEQCFVVLSAYSV
jgi:hypothetical protein